MNSDLHALETDVGRRRARLRNDARDAGCVCHADIARLCLENAIALNVAKLHLENAHGKHVH